jgi:hypothetical protein
VRVCEEFRGQRIGCKDAWNMRKVIREDGSRRVGARSAQAREIPHRHGIRCFLSRPEIYAVGLCDNGMKTRDPSRDTKRGNQGKGNGRGPADTQGDNRPSLGEGPKEVEILEERGRLVVAAIGDAGARAATRPRDEDPILRLGSNPERSGARDGSTDHDRYLYGAGG